MLARCCEQKRALAAAALDAKLFKKEIAMLEAQLAASKMASVTAPKVATAPDLSACPEMPSHKQPLALCAPPEPAPVVCPPPSGDSCVALPGPSAAQLAAAAEVAEGVALAEQAAAVAERAAGLSGLGLGLPPPVAHCTAACPQAALPAREWRRNWEGELLAFVDTHVEGRGWKAANSFVKPVPKDDFLWNVY